MTDKWICTKCKELKVYTPEIDQETGQVTELSRTKLKHCYRLMKNLTEEVYIKELAINNSGARG